MLKPDKLPAQRGKLGTKSQPLLGSYWHLKAAGRGRVSFNGVTPDILTQSRAALLPKSNWTAWTGLHGLRERGREREKTQSSVRRKVEAELESCEMDVKLINIHWVKFSKNKKTIIMKPPEHFMFMDFQANRICSRLLSVWQWTARAAVSPGFALLFKSMCLSACARLHFLCSNVGFVSLGSGLRDNEGSQLQHPCH